MGTTTRIGNSKVYKGKNGFTSTSTKIKVNQGSKWVKSSCTPKTPRRKK